MSEGLKTGGFKVGFYGRILDKGMVFIKIKKNIFRPFKLFVYIIDGH